MGFLTIEYFGVRLWIWLYLIWSFLIFTFVIWYFFKEYIKGKYYKLRFPEKVILVIIHYPGSLIKRYWRLIPRNQELRVDKTLYIYDKDAIAKEDDTLITKYPDGKAKLLIVNNIYSKKKGDKEIFQLGDTTEYEYQKFFEIKSRFDKYPEIHYLCGNPYPIRWDLSKNALAWDSKSLEEFLTNDLLVKLVSLKKEQMFMMFLMIVGIVNMLLSLFILAKIMGWLKG